MPTLLTQTEEMRVLNVPLAMKLGVNESLFLERLRFWLQHSKGYGVKIDGETYIKNTFEQWQEQFPFLSLRTMNRLITGLEDKGIIISVKAGGGYNQTKGYRIDWEHPDLQAEPEVSIVQDLHDEECKIGSVDTAKLAQCTYKQIDTDKQTEGSTTSVADVMGKITEEKDYNREEEIARVVERPTHGPTLSRFWQRAMHRYGHALKTQPQMSHKDMKILKDIVTRLPDAPDKILTALESYAYFAKFVKRDYNVILPVRPRPQKLLWSVDALAEFAVAHDEIDYENIGLGILNDGINNTDNA